MALKVKKNSSVSREPRGSHRSGLSQFLKHEASRRIVSLLIRPLALLQNLDLLAG